MSIKTYTVLRVDRFECDGHIEPEVDLVAITLEDCFLGSSILEIYIETADVCTIHVVPE